MDELYVEHRIMQAIISTPRVACSYSKEGCLKLISKYDDPLHNPEEVCDNIFSIP